MGEGEDGVAIAHDWWESGWDHFLPRQALWLHMVVSTATVKDLDGSLDDPHTRRNGRMRTI